MSGCSGCSAPPERWAVTTRSLVWAQLDVLVPAFTGIDDRAGADRVQLRPGGRGRQVPALAAGRRGAAGAALQRRRLLPRARTAACRWCSCPGRARSTSGCRCRSGARRSSTTTRTRGWVGAAARRRCESLERERVAAACRPLTPASASCSREAGRCAMSSSSWSTRCCTRATRCTRTRPGATKNATPTPFGIVYPPTLRGDARQHLRPPRAALRAAGAADARAHAPRCGSSPRPASATRRAAPAAAAERAGRRAGGESRAASSTRARARRRGGGSRLLRVAAQRRARTSSAAEPTRSRCGSRTARHAPRGSTAPAALAHSLLSTHPILRVAAGASSRRWSARAPASTPFRCSASGADDVRARAPRSCCPTTRRSPPRAAAACSTRPRSRRRCCCTSGRSATVSERRSSRQDPTVREMIERAAAGDARRRSSRCTAASTLRDPRPRPTSPAPTPAGASRPGRSAAPARSRPRSTACSFRRGGKVRIRPGADADLHARMLDGRARDDRADHDRLRRQGAPRRDDRRRPRPGAAARQRPLPVLLPARGRGAGERRRRGRPDER